MGTGIKIMLPLFLNNTLVGLGLAVGTSVS